MSSDHNRDDRHEPITAPPPAPQGHPSSEDELLGVIADVEKQLDHLRTVRAEREEARHRLEAREAALGSRQREIEELAAKVRSMEEAAAARQRTLDAAEVELADHRRKLAEQEMELAAEAKSRAADLQARATTLEQREQRLAEGAGALSRERAAIEAREAELSQQQAVLKQVREDLERERRELAAKMEAIGAEAEAARREANESRALASVAREQAQAAANRAEQLGARLRELEAAAKADADERTAELEKVRQQFASAERLVQETTGALEEARAEVRRSGEAQAALMTELATKVRELEQAAEQSAKAERVLAERQQQIQERDARIRELGEKLGGAMRKLREISQTLQEQGDVAGQTREVQAELEAKQGRIRELEASLAEARAAQRSAPEPAAASDDQSEELLERIYALEEELRAAKAELQEALDENRELGMRLREAATRRASPTQADEAALTRWRRLRLMRTMLQDQSQKLRQASEALRQRYDQCEQVLAQREEVASARTTVLEAKVKLERLQVRAAKGKSLATVFHAVAIMAVLGGISWVVAGQFAPATYAARAVIAAEGKGSETTEQQLADWQTYHEELLNDPAMLELAAERMGRRGTVSLSTPTALAERFKSDMSAESGAPGQLSVELRGQGVATTTRILETYVTALVSQANSTKERRADGLGTSIAQAPAVLGGPVSDARPVYALATFVALLGAAAAGFMVLWKRLAAAKVKFEREEYLDSILEEEAWSKPPQAFSRH